MLEKLIKLSNELDQRGLKKEADELDLLIKQAYSWNKFQKDLDMLTNQIGKDLDAGVEKAKLVTDEVVGGVKEVGKDVKSLVNMGLDEAEKAAKEAARAILKNPDVLNALSLFTKIGAAGAMAFPEPATTAAGIAVLKGSGVLDLLAAIGYFNKGENISGWSSIISAVVTVPAGVIYKAYKGIMILKSSGSMVLLRKAAPVSMVSAVIVGLEIMIEVIENGLNQIADASSSVSTAMNMAKEESSEIDLQKIKRNMKASGKVLTTTLKSIKSELQNSST